MRFVLLIIVVLSQKSKSLRLLLICKTGKQVGAIARPKKHTISFLLRYVRIVGDLAISKGIKID